MSTLTDEIARFCDGVPLRSSPTPDAGKTTLTEKLFLLGGAIQVAGSGHETVKL
jgi:hypothetical protein